MDNPIRIRGLDHIVLRAIDQAGLVRFYCEVLGCAVERRQDEIGLIQLRAGNSLIDIVGVDGVLGRKGGAAPQRDGHNLDHLCLRLEQFNLDAIRTHLLAHSVRIGDFGSRYGAEGEGPSLYLQDPQGNWVELKGPPARLESLNPPG